MKLTHYIYISTALAMLTACGEDIEPVYTVGEADNAIVLSAGVADGMPKTQTRGATRAAGDPTYVAFQTGTEMALRIDGTWLGHTEPNISQPSTGTINAVADSDKDLDPSDSDNNKDTRGVALSPQLYWDDYGTADPKNIDSNNGGEAPNGSGGRQKGLTIYGVAVDGETSAFNILPNGNDGANWTNFQWIIDPDQKTGWEKYDLLTSNNIREGSAGDGADGTYKFDNRNAANPGNLLKFTHAMSKVTVNLIAGKGFTAGKFEATPSVTLKKFVVKGHVNIINKTTTPASDASQISITPKYASGDGGGTTPAKYEAIVYPGRTLTDSDELLELEADGNKYYVTTKALYDVIGSDKTMKQGVNYVLNITVNKTAVHVEATIVDWVYVEGADAPKINVDKVYGATPDAFAKSFSVLRSAGSVSGTYLKDADRAKVNYSDDKYTMTPQLYWPTHSIHYYFRGVYPQIDKKDNSDQKLGPVIADDFVHSNDKTYIKVENEAYRSGYYPSDLMIGMPRTKNGELDETCKVEDHKDDEGNFPGGICATEGKINLNFRYVMSQVKVELYSSESTSKDHVSFGENTEVIITGGYKEGQIQLSNGVADFTKSIADYSMTRPTASEYTKYHDAIIPQTLSNGLSFKIKVEDENATGSYDYYEISVKDILVQEQQAGTPETWSDLHTIEAWEPGKIYTYKLTITKTGVKIIATITDWINVKGSTTIWM